MIGTEGDADCSMWSSAVDEGLELSQRLCESVFSGPEGEMEAEGEELMLGACTRLRTAVDKLLELLSESSQQVLHLDTPLSHPLLTFAKFAYCLLYRVSSIDRHKHVEVQC